MSKVDYPVTPATRLLEKNKIFFSAVNRVFINGGKRGFLMELDPEALRQVFPAQDVKVARSNSSQ